MASIEKRTTAKGEPRWEVRYRAGGREVSRTFRTRTDATNYRRQVEHDELRGVSYDPRAGKITLDEWWERWWPSTVDLRVSTRTQNETLYRARIAPELGAVPLGKLDHETLRAWVAGMNADGLAPSTVHKVAQILSKVLRAAADDGRLARNPAQGLALPKVETDEMRFLTPSQVATLADAIGPEWRALVVLGAYGGLRIGEMLALRPDRLDLIRGTVDVAETATYVAGSLYVRPPKTKAGRRRVPIPKVVVVELEEQLRRTAGAELVFPAPRGGGYVRDDHWRTGPWRRAVAGAGLAPLRAHDLRHTAVAFWIAAGASPKEIAARAGHTSVATVLDRYGHLLPGSEDKVNDALDALAEAAQPAPSATVLPLARDGRGMGAGRAAGRTL